MRRSIFAVACVLVASGCGNGSRSVDTPGVLKAFTQAGFGGLSTRSYEPQGDWIYTRGFSGARAVEMPIQAVRLATVAAAKRRFAADQPLLTGHLAHRERGLLPSGFQRERLREEQVCNVVVTSYNEAGSSLLRERFSAVVKALREAC